MVGAILGTEAYGIWRTTRRIAALEGQVAALQEAEAATEVKIILVANAQQLAVLQGSRFHPLEDVEERRALEAELEMARRTHEPCLASPSLHVKHCCVLGDPLCAGEACR